MMAVRFGILPNLTAIISAAKDICSDGTSWWVMWHTLYVTWLKLNWYSYV